MKVKPDVSGFSGSVKDPNDFLDGAGVDGGKEARTVLIHVAKPEATVQKLFRLRWDSAGALKVGAAQESASSGRRVTETEIVERLVRAHYGLDS